MARLRRARAWLMRPRLTRARELWMRLRLLRARARRAKLKRLMRARLMIVSASTTESFLKLCLCLQASKNATPALLQRCPQQLRIGMLP
eukprot:6485556-Amphidinium_carterae.1